MVDKELQFRKSWGRWKPLFLGNYFNIHLNKYHLQVQSYTVKKWFNLATIHFSVFKSFSLDLT